MPGTHQERLRRVQAAKGNAVEIVQVLNAQTVEELTDLLPPSFSTGAVGEEQRALRDAALAVMQQKLTASLLTSLSSLQGAIVDLDRSTVRLTKVGWWLTIVVGAVGVIASLVIGIWLAK